MGPVVEGMATLAQMQNGTYDLADVALMNDALSVRAENVARARKAAEAK